MVDGIVVIDYCDCKRICKWNAYLRLVRIEQS